MDTDRINKAIGVFCGQAGPDYTHCLNAMREAEQILHGKAHHSAVTWAEKEYRDELCRITGASWYQSARLIRATAQQRSRALYALILRWSADGEAAAECDMVEHVAKCKESLNPNR